MTISRLLVARLTRRGGSARGDVRVPLGSFGEGLHRLFSTSLHLVGARSGYLLIDEIDTGLHYSVLEDLWRLVIKTAVRLDAQVFATTHSRDCLHASANLLRAEPDLASQAAVHRVERGIPTTTKDSAAELVTADHPAM